METYVKAIILFVLILAAIFPLSSFAYEENIYNKITRFAVHFEVPPREMIALIRCETQNTFDTYIQSNARQPYGRERSFGLAQLHLPAHPEITYAQAVDSDYALIWIGQHWDKRHREWRTCMKNLKKYL